MQDEGSFPPLSRQLNLDMSTGSMSLDISMHLVRLKQLPLDFQGLLEDLPLFSSLDFSHATVPDVFTWRDKLFIDM